MLFSITEKQFKRKYIEQITSVYTETLTLSVKEPNQRKSFFVFKLFL